MSENMAPDSGLQAPGYKAPRWAWWVATGFGTGYLRPAPGTWGSLAAVGVFIFLRRLVWDWPGTWWNGWWRFGLIPAVILTWIGTLASNRVVDETGIKDPSFVVIDEWAGQWIALIPVWLTLDLKRPPVLLDAWLLVPFILFRLFDIWKPGVVNTLQALPRGRGIMADDVLAGIYAAIGTYAIQLGFTFFR